MRARPSTPAAYPVPASSRRGRRIHLPLILLILLGVALTGVVAAAADGTLTGWDRTAPRATVPLPSPIYVPITLKRWPPIPEAPTLVPISNPDHSGHYSVMWESVPGATEYRVHEDDHPAFSSPSEHTVYEPYTYWLPRPERGPGTWYYRAKACNHYGCSG